MRSAVDIANDILFPAVDEAQRSIASAKSLRRSLDSALFGDNGLDSLGLVRFIVMVEDRIEDRTSARISLASERAMSRRTSPFRTLQTLADFIAECLAEESGAEQSTA